MAGPSQALDLSGSLTVLQAVLDVVTGIPGTITTQAETPFYFAPAGEDGAVLPDGSTVQGEPPTCDYSIVSIVPLGRDESRQVYDPDELIEGDTYEPDPEDPGARLGAVIESKHGPRLITVQIKCETVDPRGGGAFTYLERARTRLGLGTITATLEAAGIAIASIGDSKAAHYTNENGRVVSVAHLEVLFNAVDIASDDPQTTIEQADKAELEVDP